MSKLDIIDSFIMNVISHNVDDWDTLRNAVVGYILRVYDSSKFNQLTNNLQGAERKKLRKSCRENSKLLLNYKLAICLAIKSKNKALIFNRCNIDPANISIFKDLSRWGIDSLLIKKLKGVTVKYPDEVRRDCGNLIKELHSYINAYVYRKLRFISNSNNLDLFDLSCDVACEAVKSYYTEVPFKSDIFLKNTVKSKIHSTGINLIKYYNMNKRKRLTQNEDGTFTGTVISTSISDTDSSNDSFDLLERIDTHSINEYKEIDFKQSINSLKTKYEEINTEARSKKYQALQILSLENHESYVKWFNTEYEARCEDVEDCYDFLSNSSDFLESIRKYFNAGPNSWSSFLDEIKAVIGETN